MSSAASQEQKPTGTDTISKSAPSQPAQPPSKKRRRRKIVSKADIRKQVCAQAQYLRRRGISPNTLFFPLLSEHSVQDHDVRAVLGTAVQSFKMVPSKGRHGCMAWVAMASEQECMDGLLQLRTVYPSLVVSFHKPSQASDQATRTLQSNQLLFDEKLAKVIHNGGVGNTLMFRNVPVEVCQEEFSGILHEKLSSTPTCDVLRVRTSVANNGNVRNFWAVFSGIPSAKSAFCVLNHSFTKFRCGKSVKLNAIVHDDSTDVDENKRRQRIMVLSSTAHHGQIHAPSAQTPVSNVSLLEAHLREINAPLLFTDLYS
ncbi:hypothetical protein FGB62_91g06 [Gracilaria domingensis]|nr:hypothetical protein FGB62_91g06 [Gracilaria domingensis]